jgi:hypothetical protein
MSTLRFSIRMRPSAWLLRLLRRLASPPLFLPVLGQQLVGTM